MNIPKHLKKVRDVTITPQQLIDFETKVKRDIRSGRNSWTDSPSQK